MGLPYQWSSSLWRQFGNILSQFNNTGAKMNEEKRKCTVCYRWYTLQDISHALAAPEDSVCKGCSWGKFFYERYTKNTTVFPKPLAQYIYLRCYLYVLDERVVNYGVSAYRDGGAEHRGVRQLVNDTERLMPGHHAVALARGYVYNSSRAAELRANMDPMIAGQQQLPLWADPTDQRLVATINPLSQLLPDYTSLTTPARDYWNVPWLLNAVASPQAPLWIPYHPLAYPYGPIQHPIQQASFQATPFATQPVPNIQPYSPMSTTGTPSTTADRPYLTSNIKPPDNDPNGPWYFYGGWWHNRPGPGQESPEEKELIRQRQKEAQDRIDRQREQRNREKAGAVAENEGSQNSGVGLSLLRSPGPSASASSQGVIGNRYSSRRGDGNSPGQGKARGGRGKKKEKR